MRCVKMAVGVCLVFGAIAISAVPVFAQGAGGAPGMPMQRMGPARGQSTGMGASLGTPGMPMQPMGRSGGFSQAASPARRSYGGMAGVPGKMSSQNFRASNMAGQFGGGGMQRSSSSVVSGVTMGTAGNR